MQLNYGLGTADVFIETGLGGGSTLKWCIDNDIAKEYHSLEFSRAVVEKSGTPILNKYKNVTIHVGSSPDLLRSMLPAMKEKTILFLLDAHFMGGYTRDDNPICSTYGQCPLAFELRAIRDAQLNVQPVILIDDADLFLEERWKGQEEYEGFIKKDWPRMAVIQSLLPGHTLSVKDNIIFCIPSKENSTGKINPFTGLRIKS